jgi:hypothetical protein
MVRNLAQPGEQAQALADIWEGCCEDEDFHFQAAIVAVGVIPLLVPLLGSGSPADVQELAAKILVILCLSAGDNRVAIAAAGAIPLVQLMGPASPVMVQVFAANLTSSLAANSENAALIAAAGAIPLLVQFLDPGDGPPALMQGMAAQALARIAVHAEDAITISAAGATPLLVPLLKPGSPAKVQRSAA